MYLAHHFTAAKPRPPLRRIADAKPMTPSEYIRLRRLAAQLTEHQLAERMAALYVHLNERQPGQRMLDIAKDMLLTLRQIEGPGATAKRAETIQHLAAVLPFDVDVYWQLEQCPPTHHPRVCRGCGTSAHDHDAPRWATRTSCERCDPAGDGL